MLHQVVLTYSCWKTEAVQQFHHEIRKEGAKEVAPVDYFVLNTFANRSVSCVHHFILMCLEQSMLQVETLLSKSPDITVLAEGGLRLRLGTVPRPAARSKWVGWFTMVNWFISWPSD